MRKLLIAAALVFAAASARADLFCKDFSPCSGGGTVDLSGYAKLSLGNAFTAAGNSFDHLVTFTGSPQAVLGSVVDPTASAGNGAIEGSATLATGAGHALTGLYGHVTSGHTSGSTSLWGVYGDASNDGSGALGAVYGGYFNGIHTGSGAIASSVVGSYSEGDAYGTTVTIPVVIGAESYAYYNPVTAAAGAQTFERQCGAKNGGVATICVC